MPLASSRLAKLLRRASQRGPEATPAPKPLSLQTTGGAVSFDGGFRIAYTCVRGNAVICTAATDSRFTITLINSPSGSGKTTLLNNLARRLCNGPANHRGLVFDFMPNHDSPEATALAYIPQHAQQVNHWHVRDLLPPDSRFLPCFFPDTSPPTIMSKHLAVFSGGQRRMLYVSSALERLARRPASHAFLLLDEALDGLGAAAATKCLMAVRDTWTKVVGYPLQILLVTHLSLAELMLAGTPAVVLQLTVQENTSDSLVVTLHNRVNE
jgi:ABC-type nitrate/sulfonate/bicarbonate transport system ATPase subunit